MSKISVLVPAYGEGENLSKLVNRIERALQNDDLEVIIINDGNFDGGFGIIRKLESEYGNVSDAASHKRRGKTKAIKDGFKESRGEIIVLIDADLQFLPEDIPKLIKELKNADAVNGLRVNRKDGIDRKFASKIFNFLVRLFFDVEFNDCNSGLKVFKREVMEDIIDELRDGWHRYMLVLAVKKGYRVVEIPIRHRKRRAGKSKFASPLRLVYGFLDLLSLRLKYGVI